MAWLAAKAVETLREEGFDGHVVLVAREAVPPYERPPLSKEVLTGKKERETVFVHDGVPGTPTTTSNCSRGLRRLFSI